MYTTETSCWYVNMGESPKPVQSYNHHNSERFTITKNLGKKNLLKNTRGSHRHNSEVWSHPVPFLWTLPHSSPPSGPRNASSCTQNVTAVGSLKFTKNTNMYNWMLYLHHIPAEPHGREVTPSQFFHNLIAVNENLPNFYGVVTTYNTMYRQSEGQCIEIWAQLSNSVKLKKGFTWFIKGL